MQLTHDPFDEVASIEEIKATWKEILQMPIQAADGRVFQFDRDSKEMMDGAILYLSSNPSVVMDWRLTDNSTVSCDHASLSNYFNELEMLRAERGTLVDAEYLGYKSGSATKRELKNWKDGYIV